MAQKTPIPQQVTPQNDRELKHFKQLLLKKKAEAEEEMHYLKTSLNNMIDSEDSNNSSNAHHMADVASDNEMIHMYYRLIGRSRNYINQLNRSLDRIENKTYGICQATGKPIPKGRLEAVPHTRFRMEAKLRGIGINKI